VVITSIPRRIETVLPGRIASATVNPRLGALVAAAGGLAVVADSWADPESLADRADAVVLNGGQDVEPIRYGTAAHEMTDAPDRERDAFELALVGAASRRRVPILGVCRGMQLLNVALGGTLHQHLPDITQLAHRVLDRFDVPVHLADFEPGSAIAGGLGRTRTGVNSVHHQAVDRLGEGLRATAYADDGTVEAIEGCDGLHLGVQWHPEFLAEPYAGEQVGLFRTLLAGVLGSRCTPAPVRGEGRA
jgi:putative glutamine amidotransferase